MLNNIYCLIIAGTNPLIKVSQLMFYIIIFALTSRHIYGLGNVGVRGAASIFSNDEYWV